MFFHRSWCQRKSAAAVSWVYVTVFSICVQQANIAGTLCQPPEIPTLDIACPFLKDDQSVMTQVIRRMALVQQ